MELKIKYREGRQKQNIKTVIGKGKVSDDDELTGKLHHL